MRKGERGDTPPPSATVMRSKRSAWKHLVAPHRGPAMVAPDATALGAAFWKGGQAAARACDPRPPCADAAGPALYVTWASWYKTSYAGLDLAQKMHERFAGEGLLVGCRDEAAAQSTQ